MFKLKMKNRVFRNETWKNTNLLQSCKCVKGHYMEKYKFITELGIVSTHIQRSRIYKRKIKKTLVLKAGLWIFWEWCEFDISSSKKETALPESRPKSKKILNKEPSKKFILLSNCLIVLLSVWNRRASKTS